MQKIEELLDLLNLEKIEENIFRGQNYKAPWGRVFGGQPLAQSLAAAYQTIPEGRIAHSMHGYFILGGDIKVPIVYDVDRIRDGGSFATRRVIAIQHGRAIFNMAASFQPEEEGFDHQIEMPNVAPPEDLLTDTQLAEKVKDIVPELFRRYSMPRPIEFRPVEQFDPLRRDPKPPFRHVWLKTKGAMPDDKRLHQIVLAYASDYNLLTTAVLPHRDQIDPKDYYFASLDHAMWFHRDFRVDDWLLYVLDSPSASNARGFSRGNIFNREGVLVASVVQEGLMRKRRK